MPLLVGVYRGRLGRGEEAERPARLKPTCTKSNDQVSSVAPTTILILLNQSMMVWENRPFYISRISVSLWNIDFKERLLKMVIPYCCTKIEVVFCPFVTKMLSFLEIRGFVKSPAYEWNSRSYQLPFYIIEYSWIEKLKKSLSIVTVALIITNSSLQWITYFRFWHVSVKWAFLSDLISKHQSCHSINL